MAINSGQSPSQNPSSKGPYDEWRKQWDKEAGRYAKTESSEHDAFFLSLFEKAYADSAQKRDRNKQWNIFTKKLFFYIILAGAVAQVALFIWTAKAFLSATASNPGTSGVTVGEIAALDALMLLTVMIILLSVNKWIGVKKYQETWARHAYTVSLYDQAMLLYLQGQHMDALSFSGLERISFPPALDKRQAFKLQILQIMAKNQEKFTVNIEEKETNLIEDLAGFFK